MTPDRTASDLVDRLAEHRTLGAAPREELAWLASHGFLFHSAAGDVLSTKGARVDRMYILLAGRIAIFVDRGAGKHKMMEWQGGDVGGLLPYSRLIKPPGDSIALEPSEILAVAGGKFIGSIATTMSGAVKECLPTEESQRIGSSGRI